ncbi:MAG TPA: hypothetical protein VGF32_28760, partial [Streptosporangiaceae bacterium]|jgi:hypothetical protein
MSTQPQPGVSGRRAVWAAGLVVAAGAGVATAHGLYQVAAASHVPQPIAWLYPLITDGLALVAYAATSRLAAGARRYAWAIVVLAASLSGLAQAVYLAGGFAAASTAPAGLRFGVGFWPAIAAALTAHLLHLIAGHPAEPAEQAVMPDAGGQAALTSTRHQPPPNSGAFTPGAFSPVGAELYSAASVQPSNPTAVQAPVQPARTTTPDSTPVQPERPTGDAPASTSGASAERPGSSVAGSRPRDRAQQAARSHYHRHGHLPTVTELADAAQVARGTAGTVLKDLREQRPGLHIVTDTRTDP